MRLTSRRDDADVIRARLRVLLAEGRRSGWLPDDDPPRDPLDADLGADLGADLDDGPGHDADDEPDPDDALPGALGRHRAPARTVRVDPGRRGSRALWVAGLLAGLALAGWTWLDRPRVEPAPPAVTSAAAPASPSVGETAGAQPTVVVSVVGLVARPGLVTLPEGARVADAVAAAGGLLPEADPASVNLAAVVADGQQIAVGVPGAAPQADPAAAPGQAGAPAGPLDLNAATVADLDALPGIGPVLAERIVAHREDHGRFTSVEQLDDVPGIGPAIYAELADLVRV
ncbi:ComEA family DNA-binding protein [Geodermatophilus sp. SYSU D00814]